MRRAADDPENAVEQTILTPGGFGLAAIAHDLGYATPQHLAVQFKRTFGRTPSDSHNRRNGAQPTSISAFRLNPPAAPYGLK